MSIAQTKAVESSSFPTPPGSPQSALKISALLAGIGLVIVGNSLQGTLLGVRAGLEGMTAETIGAFMSTYFIGYAVGSVFAPGLVERVGHIRVFAALASVASAVALAHAIIVEASVWVALRFIHGACHAGLIVIAESWLNAGTERTNRGRVLGIYGVVANVAWIVGQLMLNFSPPSSFVPFAVVSICLSLALVPVSLSRAGVPGVVSASRSRFTRLLEISPVGLVGTFFVALSMGAFWGMGPTFAQDIGLTDAGISLFMAIAMTGALLLQWPLGWVSDITDRRKVILAASAVGALACVGLALSVNQTLTVLLALSFIFGALTFPVYSLCVAHANDQVERDEVVAVASGLTLVFGAGAAIGPFAASLVMAQIGPAGLFVFCAAVLALFSGYGLWRIRKRAPTAPEEKESFVVMPTGTTHASMPLHKHGSGKAPGEKAPA
ncbi:MFS transporter [Dichotomicrobium thermohalophilum]|uniref:Putative MFS family arabinose efflux permease n=1 Tax=Dichotomicrobium thermohalophilum TaxID=933063 RepID=A0A397Q5H2_9HYPH|nr:MFS transporter [Dichotomicrobium thermohalophilum]RIA55055.1 putative MFS family arabinose efflux permease [Dichotomicrobium thermohalophilum]